VSLPPIGVAITGVPAIERLRFKDMDSDINAEPDLRHTSIGLEQIEDDFWDAFDGLDREALIQSTLALLAEKGRPVSIAELASLLPPAHDLETFALWLAMAREAGIEVLAQERQTVELVDEDERRWRFTLPYVELEAKALKDIDWES